MTMRLKDATPAVERLRPAPTAAELRWFRRKRRIALARTLLVTGGMAVLYYAGSLLRDPLRPESGSVLIGLGFVALMQVTLVVQAIRSADLVKDIRAKRTAMHEEQRKRIFLAALDSDASAEVANTIDRVRTPG